VVEPRWEGSRSLDAGAPANSAGGYQALAAVGTLSVRRSRGEMTTFGD
jgi:hypothetical protein